MVNSLPLRSVIPSIQTSLPQLTSKSGFSHYLSGTAVFRTSLESAKVFYLPNSQSKPWEDLIKGNLASLHSAQVTFGVPPFGLCIFFRRWAIGSFPQHRVRAFCGLP